MDELLMLRGEERHCVDCGTVTIHLPIDHTSRCEEWLCTACDGAVLVPVAAA